MSMRLSQNSKNRKVGRPAFKPDLKEWAEICKVAAYDNQISRHFGISKETFYAFLDRERYYEEQTGEYSEFLDSYKKERAKTRQIVSDALIKSVQSGDTSSIIFAAKTYLGLIEAKDMAHIELKKEEVKLKTNSFLTNLALKFGLDTDELGKFAEKFFKNQDSL